MIVGDRRHELAFDPALVAEDAGGFGVDRRFGMVDANLVVGAEAQMELLLRAQQRQGTGSQQGAVAEDGEGSGQQRIPAVIGGRGIEMGLQRDFRHDACRQMALQPMLGNGNALCISAGDQVDLSRDSVLRGEFGCRDLRYGRLNCYGLRRRKPASNIRTNPDP